MRDTEEERTVAEAAKRLLAAMELAWDQTTGEYESDQFQVEIIQLQKALDRKVARCNSRVQSPHGDWFVCQRPAGHADHGKDPLSEEDLDSPDHWLSDEVLRANVEHFATCKPKYESNACKIRDLSAEILRLRGERVSKLFWNELHEEVEDLAQMLAQKRQYHGANKHSAEWHDGWEACAVPLEKSLRQIVNRYAPGPGPTVSESDPENPDPPRAKRINYRCSKCGVSEASGELPPSGGGALQMYPLPPGWTLVPCTFENEDDHLHCAVCSETMPTPNAQYAEIVEECARFFDAESERMGGAMWPKMAASKLRERVAKK